MNNFFLMADVNVKMWVMCCTVTIKLIYFTFCCVCVVVFQIKAYMLHILFIHCNWKNTHKLQQLLKLNPDEGFDAMLMTYLRGDKSLSFCQLGMYPISPSLTMKGMRQNLLEEKAAWQFRTFNRQFTQSTLRRFICTSTICCLPNTMFENCLFTDPTPSTNVTHGNPAGAKC